MPFRVFVGTIPRSFCNAVIASVIERAISLRQWVPWSRYYLASALVMSGEVDRGLDELEIALEAGYGDRGYRTDPWWSSLREDERFMKLLDRFDDQRDAQ